MAANSALLSGKVVDIIQYGYKAKPGIFIVSSLATGNHCRVNCKFFCPVQINDRITLVVSNPPDNNNEHHVLIQPFVQVPVDKGSILTCFISALRKTSFGPISADSLYTKLAEFADRAGYGENAKVRREEVEAKVPSLSHLPTVEDMKPWLSGAPPEVCNDKYTGDGVIAYLSEIASNYCSTYNEESLKLLIEGTKLDMKQIKMLLVWWHKKRSKRRLHLLTLTNDEIDECHMNLDTIYNICIDNPYRLACIPVEKCKSILASIGKEVSLEQELCGSIVRKMYQNVNGKKWSRTPVRMLRKNYSQINFFKRQLIDEYFCVFTGETEANPIGEYIYLKHQYDVETTLVKFFDYLIRKSAMVEKEEVERSAAAAAPVLADNGEIYRCKTLTEEQKRGINCSFKFYLSMITGGGGVGKTVTLAETENNLRVREIPYICTSFTGKAVARIQEVVGHRISSMTLHRLISRASSIVEFKYVLVDEISMIDAYLLYRFIKTFNHDYKFIFFGDANQLRPIGWGAVMIELITSGRIPITYLTKNHRIIPHDMNSIEENTLKDKADAPGNQVFDRAILQNANNLVDRNRDLEQPFEFIQTPSFNVIDGGMGIIEAILNLLKETGIEARRISLICPFKDPCKELNDLFQKIFLMCPMPDGSERKIYQTGGRTWIVGDRVKMKENNYDINIFNGTEGDVVEISDEGVVIRFPDGIQHTFKWALEDEKGFEQKPGWAVAEEGEEEFKELTIKMLAHSAAGTVHDHQGSERDFYIDFIPRREKMSGDFLNIEMMYTMITRAKRSEWVIGDIPTILAACSKRAPKQCEGLGARLKALEDDLQRYLDAYTKPPSIRAEAGSSATVSVVKENCDDIPMDDDDEDAMMRRMAGH
jgi:hypothetical protein